MIITDTKYPFEIRLIGTSDTVITGIDLEDIDEHGHIYFKWKYQGIDGGRSLHKNVLFRLVAQYFNNVLNETDKALIYEEINGTLVPPVE